MSAAFVAHSLGYLWAVPEHMVDASWPAHARFHVVASTVWIVGLDWIAAVLVWRGAAHAWTRWVALAAFVCGQGGYVVALATVPAGWPDDGFATHAPLLVIGAWTALGLTAVFRASAR